MDERKPRLDDYEEPQLIEHPLPVTKPLTPPPYLDDSAFLPIRVKLPRAKA